MPNMVDQLNNLDQASEPADEQAQEQAPEQAPEAEMAPPTLNQEVVAEAEQPAETVPGEPKEPEVAFTWQASEFVHHQKSIGWYATLWAGVIVLMIGAGLLHLWLYIAVFLAMGVAVMIYARMPPRVMTYELSDEGVHINGKVFAFSEFRSFGVIPDEEWHSIDLEPAKRFSPRTVLLFDSEDFDSIVSHLELHLPRMDRQLDVIERVTRFLRF